MSIPEAKPETANHLRTLLLERAHLMVHFGASSLVKHLRSQGHFWMSMQRDAVAICSACIPCQRFNITKTGYHPLKTISASLPMDHLGLDLKEYPVSRSGKTYCLVIIDICTRFVWLHALENKTAASVAEALWSTVSNFGLPKIIQSDNGTEFVNTVLKEFTKHCNIDHRLITAYHARANGATERMVQTSSQVVYKLLAGRLTDWDLHLPAVQLYVNLHTSSRHGSTPYSLLFARSPNVFEDYRQ